jgi:glutamate-1-semialdehyde aminotransferase
VALAPGPYEALFPGLAHTQAEVDATAEAVAKAAAQLV